MISVFPSCYLAPIQYYNALLNSEKVIIEHYEHFIKQTYRNRCEIYSPNGKLNLSIPLVRGNHRQTMKEIKISYEYNWQTIHWRSLESSYRRSPFFEFYEDDFRPFFEEKKFKYLIDFNQSLHQLIIELLKIKIDSSFSNEYISEKSITDFRNIISPKEKKVEQNKLVSKNYIQVFETRHGFIPNLSIVDLLFNQGKYALEYI